MTYKFPTLKEGDIVDVIAPASGSTEEETEKALSFLRLIGLKPRIPDDFQGNEPYHSHSDAMRFSHLQQALEATDSKAIWCLRGGYGCARLVPMLETLSRPEHHKWLIGFSDITVLHLYFQQRWQWPTLHAPVLFQLGLQRIAAPTVDKIISLLFAQTHKSSYRTLKVLNDAAKQEQTITDTMITGGNLSLLQTSIGTPWQIDCRDKILFIEEVGEKGYRIDRMLTHLEQSRCLQEAKAIIFGDMKGVSGEGEDENIDYAITRFANSISIPVLHVPHIGHGTENDPLPLGVRTLLTLGEKKQLTCYLEE